MNKVLTNMNQDLSALEKQTARGNIGAENASNKVTLIDENSTDTQYPSAKCVFNALQNVGGGGYKDGGALIDGDYINVENNSISSYENTARSVINYYIEVKEGEPLNAIIELTNDVNATINVYKFINGVGYLLSNVGGNTVVANNYYTINIIGNTFAIENATTPDEDIYSFIDGELYGFKKIGSVYWCLEDLRKPIGGESAVVNGILYTKLSDAYYHDFGAFRLPNKNDLAALNSLYSPDAGRKLKSSATWNNGTPSTTGTNESGLGFKSVGVATYAPHLTPKFRVSSVGSQGIWVQKNNSTSDYNSFTLYDNQSTLNYNGYQPLNSAICYGIRLVMDA